MRDGNVGYGGCFACRKPFARVAGNNCICRNCAVGELSSTVKSLKEKRDQLQDSLKALLEDRITKQRQQLELRLLEERAEKARVARVQALSSIQALAQTYKPREFDASLSASRGGALQAIDQLQTMYDVKKKQTAAKETHLTTRLNHYMSLKREWQKKALAELTLVLENVPKTPSDAPPLSSAAELIDVCTSNSKLLKYYSDSFGYVLLVFGVLSPVLDLPFRYRWRYGGPRSQLWLPTSFWDVSRTERTDVHALHFPSSSGSDAQRRAEATEALAALESAVAVAFAARPSLRPRRSLMACPIEWTQELCQAAKQMCVRGNTSEEGSTESGSDGDAAGMPSELESVVASSTVVGLRGDVLDEDEDWEMLMVAEDAGGPGGRGPWLGAAAATGSAAATLTTFVYDRIKTITTSYTGN